jgi:hypothetical protein
MALRARFAAHSASTSLPPCYSIDAIFRPVHLDVVTLAKVEQAFVNEIGFGLPRRFQLENRLKTFARVALIAQFAIFTRRVLADKCLVRP